MIVVSLHHTAGSYQHTTRDHRGGLSVGPHHHHQSDGGDRGAGSQPQVGS